MTLDPAQLRTLSGLLDQALDLSDSERQAWLDGLGQEFAPLKPLLEQMLAHGNSIETGDLIGTLPRFEVADDAIGRKSDFVPGDVVGPYRLLRELGRGGMGEVWLAERSDGLVRRPVALKLPAIAGARRTLVERFTRECEILAPLTHPHIARLYDVGFTADGQPYLALEYVEGAPITVYCDDHRLDLRARVRLYLQVLEAVQYAHSNLILHRDLKPSNVLVTPAGEVRLLDFGIAKLMTDGSAHETALTQLGGRALTLDYASPEQIVGAPLTTASDVYSLGVVLYELLTGERPYRLKRGTRGELEEAILAADTARPSTAIVHEESAERRGGSIKEVRRAIDGDLDTITLKALQRPIDQRYPTVSALIEDLQRYLDGRVVLAQPENRWYRSKKLLLRNKLATGAVAAVLLSLIAGLAATLWQASLAREQARVAQHEASASDALAAFLIGLFKVNDLRTNRPTAAKELTADRLLEIGYERSKTELKDAPEIRSRLLGELSEIYGTLDNKERAMALLDERISLLRGLPGKEIELANAYKNLAFQEHEINLNQQADAHLQLGLKAIAGLDSPEARRERGNLLTWMGRSAAPNNLDQAEKYYHEAVALLSPHPVKEDDYPIALEGLADIKLERGDTAGAIQGLELMRDERAKRWGADSMMVDIVDNRLSGVYIQAGRIADADRLNAQVVAAMEKKMTPTDPSLLYAKSLHGLILIEEERWPEAMASLEPALTQLQSRQNDVAAITPGAMLSLTAVYLASGDLVRAQQIVDGAQAFVDQRMPGTPVDSTIRLQSGRLLTLRGHYDLAESTLSTARTQRSKDPPFKSHTIAQIIVRQAEVSLAQGAYASATARLDEADALLVPSSSRFGYVHDLIASRRAMIDLEQGRNSAALTRAQTVLDDQARRPEANRKSVLEAEIEVVIGRALLGLSRPKDALPHLRNALKVREAAGNPNSFWLADIYVRLAECERALGDQDGAQALLAKARAIHAVQGELGDFVTKPLQDMQILLAR